MIRIFFHIWSMIHDPNNFFWNDSWFVICKKVYRGSISPDLFFFQFENSNKWTKRSLSWKFLWIIRKFWSVIRILFSYVIHDSDFFSCMIRDPRSGSKFWWSEATLHFYTYVSFWFCHVTLTYVIWILT